MHINHQWGQFSRGKVAEIGEASLRLKYDPVTTVCSEYPRGGGGLVVVLEMYGIILPFGIQRTELSV